MVNKKYDNEPIKWTVKCPCCGYYKTGYGYVSYPTLNCYQCNGLLDTSSFMEPRKKKNYFLGIDPVAMDYAKGNKNPVGSWIDAEERAYQRDVRDRVLVRRPAVRDLEYINPTDTYGNSIYETSKSNKSNNRRKLLL